MSKFTLVRGWLECSFEEVREIKEAMERFVEREKGNVGIISSEAIDIYMRGWSYPDAPINWVSLVFYGAHINSLAIDFVRRMVSEASSVVDECFGIFYVDHEEGGGEIWEVTNGGVESKLCDSVGPRFR